MSRSQAVCDFTHEQWKKTAWHLIRIYLVSVIVTVPVCSGEAWVQFVDEVLGLQINLHPCPRLRAWDVGSDWMNKVASTCSKSEVTLQGCWAYSLNQEEPVEVLWAPYENTLWSAPARTISDMSHWMESPGQTQSLVRERLLLTVRCLGDPPRGAVICGHGPRSLGWHSQLVATATITKKSRRKMNKFIQIFLFTAAKRSDWLM